MVVIRPWSGLFQLFVKSSCKHEVNCTALLAVQSNTLVTSSILISTSTPHLFPGKSLEIISILTFTSVQGLKPTRELHNLNQTRKRILAGSWEAGSKWDSPDQPSKIHQPHSNCCYCLMMASACKSRLSAYLLPQSKEHLATGWHLTAFSNKRGKSQGQPIQPGCSAKVAVPSWGNGPLHFPQLERRREYTRPTLS